MRLTGRRVAWATGQAALLVAGAMVLVLWRPAVEWWYVRKLEFGDEEEWKSAIQHLGAMRSRKAVELILERMVELVPDEVGTMLPLDAPRQPARPSSRFTSDRACLETWEALTRFSGGPEEGQKIVSAVLRSRTAGIRARVYVAQSIRYIEDERGEVPPPIRDIILGRKPAAIVACLEALGSSDILARAGAIYTLSTCGADAAPAIPVLEAVSPGDPLHAHARAALRKLRETPEDRQVDAAYREREEMGVVEAAFRRGMTDQPNPRSDRYCLSCRSEPDGEWWLPPADMLRRLDGLPATDRDGKRTIEVVAKKLTAKFEGEEDDGPYCQVTILRWIGKFEVEVYISIHGGPEAGSGLKARAIETDAGWEVCPGSIRDRVIS